MGETPKQAVEVLMMAKRQMEELNKEWRRIGFDLQIGWDEFLIWLATLYFQSDQDEGREIELWMVQQNNKAGDFQPIRTSLGSLRRMTADNLGYTDWYAMPEAERSKAVLEHIQVLYAAQALDGNAGGHNFEAMHRLANKYSWKELWRRAIP